MNGATVDAIAQALDRLVDKNRGRWTIERIDLARSVAIDLADLAKRRAGGEAVDEKLVEAKASAANIFAAEALQFQRSIFEVITEALESVDELTDPVSAVLRRVLIGSGP